MNSKLAKAVNFENSSTYKSLFTILFLFSISTSYLSAYPLFINRGNETESISVNIANSKTKSNHKSNKIQQTGFNDVQWDVGDSPKIISYNIETIAKTSATKGFTDKYRDSVAIVINEQVSYNRPAKSTTPVQQTDLSIVNTVNISSPKVGDNVVFTLTVSNTGSSDATGVKISDMLPSGYEYVSSTGISAVELTINQTSTNDNGKTIVLE
ncbi:MAG: DUF11 domain-containing protein, partial [Rickettsiaceae bacterium]|nr:DUF11 domain-containing protein [Rickettsiaceae bacterium]